MPATLRERQREHVRREIRDVGLRLFTTNGFSATSVDEIAREAGVSRSTFFRHFGSKEALLNDPFDEPAVVFLRCLAERPAGEGRMQALENAMVCMAEEIRTDERRADLLAVRAIVDADRSLSMNAGAAAARWQYEVAVGLARRDGRMDPALEDELAAALLFQIAQHMTTSWMTDDQPVADLIRAHFETFREIAKD